MGNRCQWIWGVSWRLLGLWSTSRLSLWWSSTTELSFYLPLCYVSQCDAIIRYVRYTVMIFFYNLSTYVCDWSLGTHEFSTFNFILKIGCNKHSAQARACGLIFGPCQPDQPGENIGPCQPTARNSVNTPVNSALTSVFKFWIKFHRKHKG